MKSDRTAGCSTALKRRRSNPASTSLRDRRPPTGWSSSWASSASPTSSTPSPMHTIRSSECAYTHSFRDVPVARAIEINLSHDLSFKLLCTQAPRPRVLVHGHLHCLTLRKIGDVLSLHVDLSVHRIIRHFFTDPNWEVELLICVLQLNLCKHYAI